MMWWMLLLACDGTTEVTDSDTEAPFEITATAAVCTPGAWDWASLDEMGQVVSLNDRDDLTYEAEVLDGLLAAAELDYVGPISEDVVSYDLRYTTQAKGQTVEATALMHLPEGEGPFPVIAWAHGTSGFNDTCAPSADGLEGGALSLILASLGFVVVAPDYLGMNGFGEPSGFLHPYLDVETSAVATLDSIRAAAQVAEDEGVALTGETVLWGASEGGFVALMADRYSTHYLPELELAATVAAVPPTDLRSLALAGLTEPTPTTGALAASWATQGLWLEQDLTEVLTDEDPLFLASSIEDALWEDCSPGSVLGDEDTVEALFTETVVDAAASGDLSGLGVWSCMFDEASLDRMSLPREHDTPVMIVISGDDDLVRADVGREDIPDVCAAGYDLTVIECEGASHTEGAVWSLQAQLDWLNDRLAGVAHEGNCSGWEPIDCEAQ